MLVEEVLVEEVLVEEEVSVSIERVLPADKELE